MAQLRKHTNLLRLRTTTASPSLALLLLLLLLLSTATPATAQTSLEDLSTCGLACLLGGLEVSGCALTNLTCQCESTALTDTVTKCLLANCTMQNTLDVSRYTASQCDFPHDSRSAQILISMSTLFAFVVLVVGLRALAKWHTETFCDEDYIIISAIVLAAVPMGCVFYMAKLGLGMHLWDLTNGVLKQILLLFYVAEILYVAAMALTKASIVAMYMRIFQAYRPFRVACYGALSFIIIPSLAILLATIFSCHPVAFFWDRDLRLSSSSSSTKTTASTPSCVNVQALAYANSALALAQDTLLIVLPVFMLASLNMPRRRKLLIALMFAVGSLGLVATIVRIRALSAFGTLSDPTWDYVPVVYLTVAELTAGMVCSCLPALRILGERMWWNWTGKRAGKSSSLSEGTEGRGGKMGGTGASGVEGSLGVRMERLRGRSRGEMGVGGRDNGAGIHGTAAKGPESESGSGARERRREEERWTVVYGDAASTKRLTISRDGGQGDVEEVASQRVSESASEPRRKHDFELG